MMFSPLLAVLISRLAVPFSSRISPGSSQPQRDLPDSDATFARVIESITTQPSEQPGERSCGVKASYGIKGHVNTNATMHRHTFRLKAQNKSLLIFSGEAYNVEMASPMKTSRRSARKTRNARRMPPGEPLGVQRGTTDVADIVAFMGS